MKLERRKANHLPVAWTPTDEKLLLNYLRTNSFDSVKLSELFPSRTLPSIRSKVRKLRIQHDLFGESYRDTKEAFTLKISSLVNPKIVFDAYAGTGHQTFKWIENADKVYASEFMKSKLRQFENKAKRNGFKKTSQRNNWNVFRKGKKTIFLFIGDALDAATEVRVKNIKVDLLDLDTCGSTLPLLPTLLLLTKPRHLVITHGEFHSMRFKREDVLRRLFVHKDIAKNPLPIAVDKMSCELDKAVKVASLRAHNETVDSFWPELLDEVWLGGRFHGMLRRYYLIKKPSATSDCINEVSNKRGKTLQSKN